MNGNGGVTKSASRGKLFSGSGWVDKMISSICGYVEYEQVLRHQSRDVL